MTIKAKRFVRKPLYVDAIQVTTENIKDVAVWCRGDVCTIPVPERGNEGHKYIEVNVYRPWKDRQSKAYIGDWVLDSGKGFKVYSDPAFRSTFIFVADDEETVFEANAKILKEELENPDYIIVKSKKIYEIVTNEPQKNHKKEG